MSETPRVDEVRALKYGNVKAMDALAEALEAELAAALARVRELEGAFKCFRCGDGLTPLYCLNCAEDMRVEQKPISVV